MAVTTAESHRAGESGRGLALSCYFQLQGSRAELTAKAFVHPEREEGEEEVEESVGCVCLCEGGGWAEESGWVGERKVGGGRDSGLCSWV